MEIKVCWNVYRENINTQKIEVFNIFNHGSFYDSVLKIKKKYLKFEKELKKELAGIKQDLTKFASEFTKRIDKYKEETFKKDLESEVFYYFWAKSEYEIILTSWPPYIDKQEFMRLSKEEFNYRTVVEPEIAEKIDIYDQVKLNFDSFVEYVWNNLDLIKEVKS